MRDFERAASRLASLPLPARFVYTVFLAFTLVALALTLVLSHEMVGLDGAEVGAYYAGAVPAGPRTAPAHETGGPELDLPAEATAPPAAVPMARRKLLETTHFHLFSLPIYLLVLSHLYMLSRASNRAKLGWIGSGTVGVAAHVAAPWVATYGGVVGPPFYVVSGALLLVPMLWMCVAPLGEMWARRAPQSS